MGKDVSGYWIEQKCFRRVVGPHSAIVLMSESCVEINPQTMEVVGPSLPLEIVLSQAEKLIRASSYFDRSDVRTLLPALVNYVRSDYSPEGVAEGVRAMTRQFTTARPLFWFDEDPWTVYTKSSMGIFSGNVPLPYAPLDKETGEACVLFRNVNCDYAKRMRDHVFTKMRNILYYHDLDTKFTIGGGKYDFRIVENPGEVAIPHTYGGMLPMTGTCDAIFGHRAFVVGRVNEGIRSRVPIIALDGIKPRLDEQIEQVTSAYGTSEQQWDQDEQDIEDPIYDDDDGLDDDDAGPAF